MPEVTANALNVSTGKPKVAGGIYRAPLGTTPPTDATTALASAFVSLGYVADGGVTNTIGIETESYKAWGGDIVHISQTGKTDVFAFGLIESLNPITYETVYGSENVSGTIESGISIRANGKDLDEYVYVIELALRGGAFKRIVIPDGKITEIGDVVYADNSVIKYPVKISGIAGSDGDTHKEYIGKPATT